MPSTYNLKKEQGIKAFYDVVLHNKEGEAIGFIGIQYVDHKKPTYNNNDKESILKLKFFIEENLEALIHKQEGGREMEYMQLVVIAILIEAIWENIKMIWQNGKV